MIFDKNRREIRVGDVLKVYHFTGPRKKKYYMYKYVLEYLPKINCLKILHLVGDLSSYYTLKCDNKIHNDIEIVQGYNGDEISFEDRPKKDIGCI